MLLKKFLYGPGVLGEIPSVTGEIPYEAEKSPVSCGGSEKFPLLLEKFLHGAGVLGEIPSVMHITGEIQNETEKFLVVLEKFLVQQEKFPVSCGG